MPTLEDWQHWTLVMGRAQQMLMEFWAESLKKDQAFPTWSPPAFGFGEQSAGASDPMALMSAGAQAWAKGLEAWGKVLGGVAAAPASDTTERKDRRFAAPEWRENPIFDTIRQTYLRISDQMLGTVDEIEGVDPATREKMRFATRSFVDAMSPSNFALTNPQVLKRTLETRGENLLKGLANMLRDIAQGQLTQTKSGVFEVGRNLATTPGKVIKQTPLYQLIQYTPDDGRGAEDAGRDLPAVDQPLLHPRPHAREKLRQMVRRPGHLAVHGQLEIGRREHRRRRRSTIMCSTGRSTRSTRSATCSASRRVHAIGYCVAGTTLAATLAYLQAKGEADKVKSATFFTAQVDFSEAGDLKLFTGHETMGLLDELTKEKGYLDGRYMAATFNLLRGRDLIWNYVVNNYLLGEEPPPFDLLHWNSDTTNLPAAGTAIISRRSTRGTSWPRRAGSTSPAPRSTSMRSRPRPMSRPGARTISRRRKACGRSCTISRGRSGSCSPGSGHIAGVVNPPAAQKYQYWVNDERAATLDAFVAGADRA